MSKKEMKETLSDVLDRAKRYWDFYTEASWKKAVVSLPPGKPVPAKGVFYDDENMDRYNEKIAELRDEARAAVGKYSASISDKISKAPSEDALRAVQMFSLTSGLSAEDYTSRINDMMEKYGDNVMTYEALRGMAEANGVRDFRLHPDVAEKEAVDRIGATVEGFFDSHTAIHGSSNNKPISEGEVAFINMAVETGGDVM